MKYILIIYCIIILSSCRELVSDEFQEFTSVPTINSIIISGEPIKVHISLAEKLDTTQLTLINDASISLYADGKFEEVLSPTDNGIYFSSIIAEPLRTYSCKVNILGYSEVTCIDSLPAIPYISGIEHINKAGMDEEGLSYPAIRLTFKNDPLKRHYFEIVLRLLQNNYERHATLEAITDPVLLNEGLPMALFSNEYINESSYTMLINYSTGSASASSVGPWHTILYPLIVELRQVSYNYYQFVRQKYLYELGRYPEFMATSNIPFPLYSNVTGGYGIFAGYSVMKSDTIYPVN